MGKIIVIDGLDGTGKQTQSELLFKYIKDKNEKVKLIAFPRYNSSTGLIIKEYLSGKINSNDGIGFNDRIRTGLLYSYDRMYNMYFIRDEKGNSIMDYYNNGYTIICDRYTSSNYLFMTCGMDMSQFSEFINTIEKIEYMHMGLPEPDMTIFLEMPPEKSLELIEKRGEEKDLHENLEILNKAYNSLQLYKSFLMEKSADTMKKTYFINCMDEFMKLYSKEDISEMVKNLLQM